LNKKVILVVDDDEPIRESLREFFESSGFNVLLAEDGEHALNILEVNEKPDLIIFDTQMPKVDGWEFKAALQSNPRFKEIPNFVFSALSRQPPPGLNATGFIAKPVKLEDLEKLIKTYL
jgi:CheY-like chemotaxis protein